MNNLPPYKYGSARTMVDLHGKYLVRLVAEWRKAKAINLVLPETDDTSYVSLETLLHHFFQAARAYMVWIADKLDLPDPQIDPVPALDEVEAQADAYVAHIIDRWRTPLADVEEERYGDEAYVSNWGMLYHIDSMLEHAVVHTILHRVQLEELIEEATTGAG